MTKTSQYVLFSALAISIWGCDFGGTTQGERLSLSLQSEANLSNDQLEVESKSLGMINRIDVFDESGDTHRTLTGHAGMWMARETNPVQAAAFAKRNFGYQFSPLFEAETGYLYIDQEIIQSRISNWPSHLGAPSEDNGQPKLYGDRMTWSLFEPDTSKTYVMNDVAFGMTTYLFEEEALSGYAFHRIDVINVGDSAIENLHLGYGADMDINPWGRVLGPECESLNHHDNQMGLDLERYLHFVYLSPHPEDGQLPARCYGSVSAFSVLPMNAPGGIGGDKLASRIWRRDDNSSMYPEFWETLDTTPETILNALKGLSASGAPMINPDTGESTKYAFTGDPIEGTGWIDERHDGRQLISLQPITLAPGEKVGFTTVWLHADEPNLADALASLKSQYDYIMSRREVWDY